MSFLENWLYSVLGFPLLLTFPVVVVWKRGRKKSQVSLSQAAGYRLHSALRCQHCYPISRGPGPQGLQARTHRLAKATLLRSCNKMWTLSLLIPHPCNVQPVLGGMGQPHLEQDWDRDEFGGVPLVPEMEAQSGPSCLAWCALTGVERRGSDPGVPQPVAAAPTPLPLRALQVG